MSTEKGSGNLVEESFMQLHSVPYNRFMDLSSCPLLPLPCSFQLYFSHMGSLMTCMLKLGDLRRNWIFAQVMAPQQIGCYVSLCRNELQSVKVPFMCVFKIHQNGIILIFECNLPNMQGLSYTQDLWYHKKALIPLSFFIGTENSNVAYGRQNT